MIGNTVFCTPKPDFVLSFTLNYIGIANYIGGLTICLT